MLKDRQHIDPHRFVYLLERGMAKKGLSQGDLALEFKKAGLPIRQSTVSNWLNGVAIPRSRYLKPLMEILDFTWEDMLTPQAMEVERERPMDPYEELSIKYQQLEARVRELERILNATRDQRPFRSRSVA